MKKSFTAIEISREDFKALGYDASWLSDEQMEEIASDLCNCVKYNSGDYNEFMLQYAEENLDPINYDEIREKVINVLNGIFEYENAEEICDEIIEDVYENITARCKEDIDSDIKHAVQEVLTSKIFDND